VRSAEILEYPFALVAAYGAVGLLYMRQGDLEKALPMLERSLSLCQAADIPLLLPTVAANLGAAYTLCGRLTDALPLLEQAVAQAAARQLLVHHALQVASLSEAYLQAGRREEAQTLATRALELARARRERGHEAYTLRLLGAIAAQHFPAEAEAAGTFYQQALALANKLGMQPLLAHCHLSLGTLYGRMGQKSQARDALSAAIALFRSMDMTFWLPQAEAAFAQMD
jgi:tetratricopeptide (TPR) repeat protein